MPKSTEAGHHEKRVYISQYGQLIVPSSATIKVEAGGLLCVKPSTGGYTGAYATQVANTLPNRGVSIIRTTDSVGVDVLAQPTKDVIGTEKLVIWDTTAKRKLRLATAAGIFDVKCGSSSASVIVASSDVGKFAHKGAAGGAGLGAFVKLLAASTNRWIVTGINPPMTTNAKYFIFSSCT